MKNTIIETSVIDLAEDIQLLLTIIKNLDWKLSTFSSYPNKEIFHNLAEQKNNLLILKKSTQAIHKTEEPLISVNRQLQEIFLTLRKLSTLIAAYCQASHFQSPAFIQTSKEKTYEAAEIKQSLNDYKRDQHYAGNKFQEQFVKEYVAHPFFRMIKAFATSSGMAALTTILGFLEGEEIDQGNILAGKHSYFETLIILKKKFGNRLILVDETDEVQIQKIISELKPSVIFLDTLGNNKQLTVPHIAYVFKTIQQVKYNPFVVLDNTSRSILFQSFITSNHPKNLLIWESLLKYYQYGFDTTQGGIILSPLQFAEKIYMYRDHLGTNAHEADIFALPIVDKNLLKKRLKRHGRNAFLLSKKLQEVLKKNSPNKIADILYPEKTTHDDNSFYGSLVTIQWKEDSQSVRVYQQFFNRVMALAIKRNVTLVGGTSFGFPVTRLYIPASRPGQGEPFFRIAVGTEPLFLLEKLVEVFEEAIAREQ